MKTKKAVSILLALVMLFAVMTGCSDPGSSNPSQPPAENSATPSQSGGSSTGTVKMTYIVEDLNNEFFTAVINACEYAADQLGVDLSIVGSSDVTDASTQVQYLENCVSGNQDAIILGCSNSDGVATGVKTVQEAGIPIVCVENGILDETAERFGIDVPPFYGSDSYQQGEAMAKWVMKNYPKGTKMILLEGQAGSSPNVFRIQAWNDTVPEGYYEVVGQQNCNWVFDDAYDCVQNLLISHPDVEFIACFNDSMALGAQAATRDAGLDSSIDVMGMNGDQAAIEALRAGGNFVMTIGCQPGLYGLCMVNDLYNQVVNGVAPKAMNYMPVAPITQDTVEDYAASVLPFYQDNYAGSIDDQVPNCQW